MLLRLINAKCEGPYTGNIYIIILFSFIKQHDPSYKFQTVTVNKNHAAAKHVDVSNKGHSWIIGLGNYTGGELVFTDKKSPYYGTHNIKNKWLKFVGDTEHYVKPFKGERYTLVYYNWK
eukprot:COSAG05_NODE_1332_length_5154_cov_7.919090_5_plen_119_part_00